MTKQRQKPSLLFSLPIASHPSTQMFQVLRRPLLCLIQPCVSLGPTASKSRWFPRLHLCHLHLHTALLRLSPSGLILSRARRRQAAAAGKPTAAANYGLSQSYPTPPTVPPPVPTARKLRPPRTTSPLKVSPRSSVDPIPTVLIRPTTDVVTPALPLLGTLLPDVSRRVGMKVALPKKPSPAEIEFVCQEMIARR